MIIDNLTPDDEVLAMIEKHSGLLDTDMAQFACEIEKELYDKNMLLAGSKTVAAFIEAFTGKEGADALLTFAEELASSTGILTWNTFDKSKQTEYRRKAGSVEDFFEVCERGFRYAAAVDNVDYTGIFDFQVRGKLRGDISGISTVADRSIGELQKSATEWYVPIVRNKDAKGFELIADYFKRGPQIVWGLTNYSKVDDDLTIHFDTTAGLGQDIQPECLFVSVKHIAPENAYNRRTGYWLPKDVLLTAGYPVLKY